MESIPQKVMSINYRAVLSCGITGIYYYTISSIKDNKSLFLIGGNGSIIKSRKVHSSIIDKEMNNLISTCAGNFAKLK